MIAVDTNILVYAHRAEMDLHPCAAARLTALAEGDALWALPVFCVTEFLRVVTHPGMEQFFWLPDGKRLPMAQSRAGRRAN